MPTRVLAAVIRREGSVLVCQRPSHKRHGGMWEFPGGKVEEEETDAEALERELDEELGVRLTELSPAIFSAVDPGSEFVIEFVEVEIDGVPECREHVALEWATPNTLRGMHLAPSDRRFVDEVLLGAVHEEAVEEAAAVPPTSRGGAPDV
jgi:mutator protein MutT